MSKAKLTTATLNHACKCNVNFDMRKEKIKKRTCFACLCIMIWLLLGLVVVMDWSVRMVSHWISRLGHCVVNLMI